MLNKKQSWGDNWNRWVATNIHLDQYSLLMKQWSPLHWVPPSDEEIYVEFGLEWATCLGAGVALLWWLNKAGSFVVKCPWSIWSLYYHCMPIIGSRGWALLVSVVLLRLRCPIMVGNKNKGDPRWTLGAGQGKEECCAQKNYPPWPWWWCTVHNGVGEAFDGVM